MFPFRLQHFGTPAMWQLNFINNCRRGVSGRPSRHARVYGKVMNYIHFVRTRANIALHCILCPELVRETFYCADEIARITTDNNV